MILTYRTIMFTMLSFPMFLDGNYIMSLRLSDYEAIELKLIYSKSSNIIHHSSSEDFVIKHIASARLLTLQDPI